MEAQFGISPLDFHHGEALLRVAGHYSTLIEVVFEAVQNALDAKASGIYISVSEKSPRDIIVSDDGVGTTQTKFEKALTSVCCSIKDDDDLGRFGMGLIAPLNKCEMFTFTSTPKSNPKAYLKWTFITEEIRSQSKIQGIPVESVPGLFFERMSGRKNSRPGSTFWRTQVKIRNFTKDRILSRISIPLLRDGILQRFSTAMRNRNTVVFVTIRHADGSEETDKIEAQKFQGRRLSPVRMRDGSDKLVTSSFELYIARKGARGRRGSVLVGQMGNDYRLGFPQFARHSDDLLSGNIVEALNSGIFEGEILSSKIEIDPSRKYFIANDNLVNFCVAIEKWWSDIGMNEYLKVQEEVHEQRYQALGLRSMNVIKALLDKPEFKHLLDVVKSFQVGTIGIRHSQPSGKIIGTQEQPASAVKNGQPDGNKSDRGTSNPDKEHPGHTPFTVLGPRGRPRTLVKHNSLGLSFAFEEMVGDDDRLLWRLDTVHGILHFNERHELFVSCDDKEKNDPSVLMRFMEHIAQNALLLETVPEDWKERHRQLFDESLKSFVFCLKNADHLAGRGKGQRKAPAESENVETAKTKKVASK